MELQQKVIAGFCLALKSPNRTFGSEVSDWLLHSEQAPRLFSWLGGCQTEWVDMLVEWFKGRVWSKKRKSRNSREGSGQVFVPCRGVFGSMPARWDFTPSLLCEVLQDGD